MAKFQIENPGTVVGESIRCLSARLWRQEKFNGRGNWRIAFADVARLRWIVGGKDCRKILKALGSEPEPEKSYRTYNGRSQPLNLTINPKTWSLLSSIARCYGRENHGLTISFLGTVCCQFGANPELAA